MSHVWTRFESWLLKRLLRKIVAQHLERFLFRTLREIEAEEWFEDNWPTRESYLFDAYSDPASQPHSWGATLVREGRLHRLINSEQQLEADIVKAVKTTGLPEHVIRKLFADAGRF